MKSNLLGCGSEGGFKDPSLERNSIRSYNREDNIPVAAALTSKCTAGRCYLDVLVSYLRRITFLTNPYEAPSYCTHASRIRLIAMVPRSVDRVGVF
jgi:hypothetical protein